MIHHTQATFGSGAGLSDVILLRSEIITNSDGFGGPMHDVRVVVVNGGRVIADYGAPMRRSPENNRPGLHVDAYLDLTHITGDGIPEILFHSGYQGVSDSVTYEHILHYNASSNAFSDVSREEFNSSGTHGLRWASAGERVRSHR